MHLKKGSAAAKAHMKRIRSMRGGYLHNPYPPTVRHNHNYSSPPPQHHRNQDPIHNFQAAIHAAQAAVRAESEARLTARFGPRLIGPIRPRIIEEGTGFRKKARKSIR